MLVKRWGIFWRAIDVHFALLPTVITCTLTLLIWQLITVACKLHNICLARFKLDHPRKATPEEASESVERNRRDSKVGDNEEVRILSSVLLIGLQFLFADSGFPQKTRPTEQSAKRQELTRNLRDRHITRPKTSAAYVAVLRTPDQSAAQQRVNAEHLKAEARRASLAP